MKNYTALIIDMKKSRSYTIEDRNAIQYYIFDVLEKLNDLFSYALAKNVEFSAGDEVQGLFICPEAAYLYFRIFSMLISPTQVRAGIGVGEWNVKIDHASTTVQDGPAYHNARRAIESVKDTLGYSVLLYSGSEMDLYLNAVINTAFALTDNHSEYQNELMILSELLYPIDYGHVVNSERLNSVFELLTRKNKLDYYSYYKKSRSMRNYPFDEIQYRNPKPFVVDALNVEEDFFVSGGRTRGMSLQLSEILNISRQSIEKTFRTANIYEARNSTIVALKFMDKFL